MTKLRPKDNENYVCKFKISIANLHHKITEKPKSRNASAVILAHMPARPHRAPPTEDDQSAHCAHTSWQPLQPKEDENHPGEFQISLTKTQKNSEKFKFLYSPKTFYAAASNQHRDIHRRRRLNVSSHRAATPKDGGINDIIPESLQQRYQPKGNEKIRGLHDKAASKR